MLTICGFVTTGKEMIRLAYFAAAASLWGHGHKIWPPLQNPSLNGSLFMLTRMVYFDSKRRPQVEDDQLEGNELLKLQQLREVVGERETRGELTPWKASR